MPKLFNSLFVAGPLVFEEIVLAGLAATDCHLLGGALRTEQHTEKAALTGFKACKFVID